MVAMKGDKTTYMLSENKGQDRSSQLCQEDEEDQHEELQQEA